MFSCTIVIATHTSWMIILVLFQSIKMINLFILLLDQDSRLKKMIMSTLLINQTKSRYLFSTRILKLRKILMKIILQQKRPHMMT